MSTTSGHSSRSARPATPGPAAHQRQRRGGGDHREARGDRGTPVSAEHDGHGQRAGQADAAAPAQAEQPRVRTGLAPAGLASSPHRRSSPGRDPAGAPHQDRPTTRRRPAPAQHEQRPRASDARMHGRSRPARREQRGQVEAGPLEPLGVRREARRRARSRPPRVANMSGGLDDVALDPAGTATISRTRRRPSRSSPTCTTRSTLAATVGTTNRGSTFSPASSGSVHILISASRAELAWIVHMPGQPAVERDAAGRGTPPAAPRRR